MPLKAASNPDIPSKPPAPRKHRSRRKLSPPTQPLKAKIFLDAFVPHHIFKDRSVFTSYSPKNEMFATPFGSFLVAGIGTVMVTVTVHKKPHLLVFKDCWHMPEATSDLFSMPCAAEQGMQCIISLRGSRLVFPLIARRMGASDMPKYVPFSRQKSQYFLAGDFTKVIPLPNPSNSLPKLPKPTLLPTVKNQPVSSIRLEPASSPAPERLLSTRATPRSSVPTTTLKSSIPIHPRTVPNQFKPSVPAISLHSSIVEDISQPPYDPPPSLLYATITIPERHVWQFSGFS